MSNIYKYNQKEKATVCADKNCVTVYGETAQLINGIALIVALTVAIVVITKALS